MLQIQDDQLIDILRLKFIIIGPINSGKTQLLIRLFLDEFIENYCTTAGYDFGFRRQMVNNHSFIIQIFDSISYQRFGQNIPQSFFRQTNGVFLTFDVTDQDSFSKVQFNYEYALQQIENMNLNTSFILVGCKCDLESSRKISFEEALQFATSLGIDYIETSAKNNWNCCEALEHLIYICLKNDKQIKNQKLKILKTTNNVQTYPCC